MRADDHSHWLILDGEDEPNPKDPIRWVPLLGKSQALNLYGLVDRI